MKINLEINNITQSPITEAFFVSVVERTLTEINYNFLSQSVGGKNISISLALVSPEEIRKLNKEYRQHNESTDVLSFPEYKNLAEIKDVVDNELFLGELILCYDDVKEYAEKESIELEYELAKVVAHGILHLFGFNHGLEMFEIQEKIAKINKK